MTEFRTSYGSAEAALLSGPPTPASRARAQRRWKQVAKKKGVLSTVMATPSTSSDSVNTSSVESERRVREVTRRLRNGKKYSFVYSMLSPDSKSPQALVYKRCITILILVDLLLFILSTEVSLMNRYESLFEISEGIASSIFLFEYVARMVTITEKPRYAQQGPILGRLSYAFTWGAIIDLAASLPFFLEIPTGWELPTLTYLRFFRLFRILKTEGQVKGIDAVYRVIYFNREILTVALHICLLLILVTSVLLYYFRPINVADQEDFQSIFATMYLSTLMLMGQGGPDGDLPWYTRAVVVITSFFSVAMFAIPASMLTWGFESEAERLAKKARRKVLAERRGSSSATISPDEEDESETDTDEEYFKIIAGEEDEEEEDDETALAKELRSAFQSADKDADGSISMVEFMKYAMQGKGVDSSEIAVLKERLNALEKTVKANNKKLDQILAAVSKLR